MASNLSRLFSSIIELSTPKLGLQCVRSKPMNHSASRLIFSSTQHRHQENPKEPESEILPPSSLPATKKEGDAGEEAEEGEDEDDVDMNKETGEVGGPRGPEPTRYGDWERNGRCYDF